MNLGKRRLGSKAPQVKRQFIHWTPQVCFRGEGEVNLEEKEDIIPVRN